MKKLLSILPIICFIFFYGCHKKSSNPDPSQAALIRGHSPPPCIPHTTFMSNPTLLSCKYKTGSYWVFKDSISGDIDTLVAKGIQRYGYLYMGQGCDTSEIFVLTLNFKRETISAFKTMEYWITNDSIMFQDKYLWTVGSQHGTLCFYSRFSSSINGRTMYDSLMINNIMYKDVGESIAIQFIKDDPTRMETQTMKFFFNPEFGPIRFDMRDRMTDQLISRRFVTARNILR